MAIRSILLQSRNHCGSTWRCVELGGNLDLDFAGRRGELNWRQTAKTMIVLASTHRAALWEFSFDCGLWSLALWNPISAVRSGTCILYLLPMLLRSSLTHPQWNQRPGREFGSSRVSVQSLRACKHGSVCVGSRKCGWLPIMFEIIVMRLYVLDATCRCGTKRWTWHSHLHGPILAFEIGSRSVLDLFGDCVWWELSFQAPRLELKCKSYKRAKTDFLSSLLLNDFIGRSSLKVLGLCLYCELVWFHSGILLILVFALHYKTHHIPLKYGCMFKKSDHISTT